MEKPSVGFAPSTTMPIGTTMSLALDAQQRGDLEQASNLYRQVLLVQPENIDALHMLGVIHFTRGDLRKAEQLIRHAEGLCPAPVHMIQHNLMMLREKIAVSNAPTDPVLVFNIDSPDSPITRVEEACVAQEITLPALCLDSAIDPAGIYSTPKQKSLFPSIKTFALENAVVDAESAIRRPKRWWF